MNLKLSVERRASSPVLDSHGTRLDLLRQYEYRRRRIEHTCRVTRMDCTPGRARTPASPIDQRDSDSGPL
jgi:hypothetical protein